MVCYTSDEMSRAFSYSDADGKFKDLMVWKSLSTPKQRATGEYIQLIVPKCVEKEPTLVPRCYGSVVIKLMTSCFEGLQYNTF